MKRMAGVIGVAGLLTLLLLNGHAYAGAVAQQATPVITVTGTPEGPQVLVPDQVNVRLGPSTDYELVGVLIAGQTAPALGRSQGHDWIEIVYPGVPGNVAWVYAPLVQVINLGAGDLPIVEPPPTPVPRVTATIDPTLAAQFNLTGLVATPLPTYTPSGPLPQATLAADAEQNGGRFPPIVAIVGLLVVGGFGTVISFLRAR